MMIYFSLSAYFIYGVRFSASEYLLNLLFIYNLVPGHHESIVWAGWTIGVEMIFYALLPMVLAVVNGVRGVLILFSVSCAAAISSAIFYSELSGLPSSFAYMSFLRATPSFAAGLLAFHISKLLDNRRIDQFPTEAFSIITICFFLLGALVLPFNAVIRWDLICWSLLFGACCVWQSRAPSRVLSCAFSQYIGERSYSVYLVHAPTIYGLIPIYKFLIKHLPPYIAFVACLAVSVFVVVTIATVTYRFVEAPFIRIGAKLASGRSAFDRSPPSVRPPREPHVPSGTSKV
jgi:peptidoglycan/LPS O-acetylase OafA/YrhL